MKTKRHSHFRYGILTVLIVALTSCHSRTYSQTIDLGGPQFDFSIINLSNNRMINHNGDIIEVVKGDQLRMQFKAIDYNEEADNTVSVALFDFEECYKNQNGITVTIIVPSIEPGKYPATVVYERQIESTETTQWILGPKSEITLYVVVK